MAGNIVIMDSASHLDSKNEGDVVVCGSHGGESAARHILRFKPVGVILNDAGIGKEKAGIKGLAVLDEAGIPAATVNAWSARIGDGTDTYESGIISAVNRKASILGIAIGETAKKAGEKMLNGRVF